MSRYLVRVFYRETTDEDPGEAEPEYRATYEVEACDAEQARRLALGELRRVELESLVDWVRVVEAVECEAIAEDALTRRMTE